MTIWHRQPDPAAADLLHQQTLVGHLGIRILEVGDDYLVASMPVDVRTVNPMGLLHGGATMALAETLGSYASNQCVDPGHYFCVGLEINANHIRSVTEGQVFGRAEPLHLGRRTHVWRITVTDDAGKLVAESRLTVSVIRKQERNQ